MDGSDYRPANRQSRFSPEDRKALLQGSFSTLTTEEQWRWHAYMRVWRKHTLPEKGDNPPFDPTLKWYDEAHEREAERVYRIEHPEWALKRYLGRGPKPSANEVRDYWQIIRSGDLTEAEFALFLEANRQSLVKHGVDLQAMQETSIRRVPGSRPRA